MAKVQLWLFRAKGRFPWFALKPTAPLIRHGRRACSPPLSNTWDTQATEPLNDELSEPLQQHIKLLMEFFLALASRSTRQRQEEPETKAPRRCQWCLKPAPMATRASSAWDAGSEIFDAILRGLMRNWFLIHARKSRRRNTYADEG